MRDGNRVVSLKRPRACSQALALYGVSGWCFLCSRAFAGSMDECAAVTVCLLSHGIFLLSFSHCTHLLFGICSYDWIHCLILLSSLNSSFIEL